MEFVNYIFFYLKKIESFEYEWMCSLRARFGASKNSLTKAC